MSSSPSSSAHRRKGVAATRVAVATGLSALLFAIGAAAAPPAVAGSPGEPMPDRARATGSAVTPTREPADPRPLFVEDFENDPSSTARLITDYVGSTGTRYSADPIWADAARCNGLVVGAGATTPGCAAGPALRSLAQALGVIGGDGHPEDNRAISAYTNGGAPGADKVQLETVAPVPVDVANRFVTFSVDTVAVNCSAPDDPLLSFSLLDGDVETPVSDTPINPCLDPDLEEFVVDGHTIRGGTVASKGALLFSGTELGVRLRNLQGGGAGNDGAFDNVRVVDATPQADLSLPAAAVVGDVVDLVLDVTNTSEAGAKPGWSFAQTLPDGLTVASSGEATSTCSSADVTAPSGADAIRVQADFAEGDVACRVVVPVLASASGSHVVAASQSTLSGLLPAVDRTIAVDPEAASVDTRLDARLDDVAEGGAAGVADVGDRLTWVQTVVNVGNAPVHDLASTRRGMSCNATDLPVGARASCTSPTYLVDQEAVDEGGPLTATVRAGAVSRLGIVLSTDEARAEVPVTDPAGSMGIDSSVTVRDADGADRTGEDARPGDVVDARYTLTNQGTVTLTDVALQVVDGMPQVGRAGAADEPGAEIDTDCEGERLAPGDSFDCVIAPQTIVEDDLGSPLMRLYATATGFRPDGTLVQAPRASDPIGLVKPAPALTASAVVTKAGGRVDEIAVGDAWRGRVRVVNTGNVEVSGLWASGFTCDVDRLGLGRATHCTSAPSIVTSADARTGRVAVSATVRGVDRWGSRVTATSSAEASVPGEAVAPAQAAPVAAALAFTGSPLGHSAIGLGVLLSAAGALAVVTVRRRPGVEASDG
jgi:uncharacterized repeat protein (TIGR01451 family)